MLPFPKTVVGCPRFEQPPGYTSNTAALLGVEQEQEEKPSLPGYQGTLIRLQK